MSVYENMQNHDNILTKGKRLARSETKSCKTNNTLVR